MPQIRELPPVGDNAGLALSRSVPWTGLGVKDDGDRRAFFAGVSRIEAGSPYKLAFDRWTKAMAARKALCVCATLGGPLAVGLGNGSPYETGLTLHRVYGMPLVPGSAIKGACLRAIAHLGQTDASLLFGSPDKQGAGIFHDAWYDPDSVDGRPLAADTVTVHHPNYYKTQGEVFPTDFDDPVPVPFVSVRPGASFFFAIEIPGAGDDWLDFAENVLRHALTQIGLGGKTNAGYGWFSVPPRIRPPSLEDILAGYRERIGWIKGSRDLPNMVPAILRSAGNEGPEVAKVVAQALKELVREKMQLSDRDTRGKSWWKEIEKALGE